MRYSTLFYSFQAELRFVRTFGFAFLSRMNAMNQVIRRVKGFFQLGERDAFTRIDELASLGEESLHLLVKILTNSPNGLSDVETCTNRISLLEKQGDKIVQSLEEMFGKGSISALLMREFERLADSVDGVLDRAHALSRQIRRVTKKPLREAKEFDAIIRKDQVRLIEIALVQLQGLRKLFNTAGSDMKQSVELAKQIELLEEQGDDIKDNMLDEIYGSWEVLDYASFHNYIETTIEADDILDRCEDASDLVIVIMKGLGA